MTYENRVCNGNPLNGHNYGIEFYGNDGTLFVDRARASTSSPSGGRCPARTARTTGGRKIAPAR